MMDLKSPAQVCILAGKCFSLPNPEEKACSSCSRLAKLIFFIITQLHSELMLDGKPAC